MVAISQWYPQMVFLKKVGHYSVIFRWKYFIMTSQEFNNIPSKQQVRLKTKSSSLDIGSIFLIIQLWKVD